MHDKELEEKGIAIKAYVGVTSSGALGLTQQGESKIKDNTPGLVLPEYTRVDLAAYYVVAKNLTVQMNVENLMDELYFPHSHSTHQATVGESVNTRVSMRWTY